MIHDDNMDRSSELLKLMTTIREEWKPKGTRWFNTIPVLDTIASSFNSFALYRCRDPIAVVHAEKSVSLNRNSSYIIFSGTHICLRLLCEAAAGIWRDLLAGGAAAEAWKGIEVERPRTILKESIAVLQNLNKLYVVVEATLLYYKGVMSKLEGDHVRAKRILERGLAVSRKLNLRLEEGLFVLELCLLDPQPKLEQLIHACDIIESTGSNYYLSLARRYLNLDSIFV